MLGKNYFSIVPKPSYFEFLKEHDLINEHAYTLKTCLVIKPRPGRKGWTDEDDILFVKIYFLMQCIELYFSEILIKLLFNDKSLEEKIFDQYWVVYHAEEIIDINEGELKSTGAKFDLAPTGNVNVDIWLAEYRQTT